ncbi:MAG: sigma-70 family RNA polymerase sigma factor [Anaerolineales bacterium]|nr:sigma-70 family RNA polymerase sigma factor [Anaerolineales bacterium]MCB8961088.1 sigma-70 family RNA polymerase sigma factor [Ardenticatenales bacterium]MCB0007710.1 sigma-70 family RNA polymerase sigma factor [Anaerolineales bacterium]MCB0012784.1 sigma-70 family RNA polymerase sigma factor [Anaerolineales bacterium]MCB0019210.1 sigma-70 family RNA polymerase sigma factor [Anaerolineales bacterium]
MNEAELIARARTDKEAFGELYELYVERIYNYVYYRVGNEADAEDLTSKIFYRAMQHISRYEDKGVPFSAWLYRIARNLVANWYRDQSRRTIISLDDIAQWQFSGEGPELSAEWEENQEALLAAIRRLPAERQEMLILKFVDRQSNADIGRIMGRSEGAIKSLYHRTLLSLREELTQMEQEADETPANGGWRRWLRRKQPSG